MLKVRLIKSRYSDYGQLLESATIPDIESLDDLFLIARALGSILRNYASGLKDPNIYSVLADESIKNWTIQDLESIQYLLGKEGFQVLITSESSEDLGMTEGQVKIIIVEENRRTLEVIPQAKSIVMDKKVMVDSIGIIDVLESYFKDEKYFDEKKFVNNPLKDMLEQLTEARKVLGTINPSAMARLNRMISGFGKRLLAVSQS